MVKVKDMEDDPNYLCYYCKRCKKKEECDNMPPHPYYNPIYNNCKYVKIQREKITG